VSICRGSLSSSSIEVHAFRLGDVPEGAIDVILQLAESHLGDIHSNRARFDLRQVENVVDESEQVHA